MAERLLCKQEVSGSIPDVSIASRPTNQVSKKARFGSLTGEGGGFTLLDPPGQPGRNRSFEVGFGPFWDFLTVSFGLMVQALWKHGGSKRGIYWILTKVNIRSES